MILIACEESQTVTIEFRKLGFEVYSCDLLPCSGGHPEWHLQQNVIPLLKEKWDMIIAFPPCTHLSVAGAQYWKQKQIDGRQQNAIDFFTAFVNAKCNRIAIENPVGIMSTKYRKPDQVFHPYQFGDPFKKRTCLWLKNLPALNYTNQVEPKAHWVSCSTRGGILRDGTRKKSALPVHKSWNSSKERSKTFPGIAKTMATQWGEFLRSEAK